MLIINFYFYLFFIIFIDDISSGVGVLFFSILLLFPLFIDGVFDVFLDKTLSRLSIKVDYASIRLADDEFLFISKIAEEEGITLKTSCNILDKNKLIHDVNILWSVGQESLIEIVGNDNEENRRIRLAINNDNMKSIRISSPRKCIFKEFKNVFEDMTYNIKDDEIKKVKDFINGYKKDDISKIRVYGVLESKSYNEVRYKNLSEDWVKAMAEKLSPDIPKDILSFEKFEYVSYCKKNLLNLHTLKDCEEINKGIILELELKNEVQKNKEQEGNWFKFKRLFNAV